MGADVHVIEISSNAVNILKQYTRDHGLSITVHHTDAMNFADCGPFDFIFGSMILHHIEPFEKFAEVLDNALKPGGKAFFLENNANSRLLVWFRNNIVGKWGVPKKGDDKEFPLTPDEVDCLRKKMHVRQEFPEMFFFRLIPMYLLRGKFSKQFQQLDKVAFRIKVLRKLSYRQYLYISK